MANRLGEASSPYLRQHRDNPVDWYQWGPEAFTEAQQSGRPILLSIGYSACHWCHVMAHESFEDPATAAVMNRLFVNVKVDREERPDVDAVYMDAVQALTGRGGWPMTMFLTPTGEPFYGGTYYPRETFVQLMNAVDDAWQNRRDELQQNVDALVEAIGRTAHIEPAQKIETETLVSQAVAGLRKSFDTQWGGFGGAPKFPSTFNLDLLLRVFARTQDPTLYSIVRESLDAMAAGGMYDQIGGGFCRYSVDEQWLVPHFEKMLYDQALLLRVYLHAWQLRREQRDEQISREIINYVLTDLCHPDGGFYSAEDADSLDESGHSHEGIFYTWTPSEIRDVLANDADDALTYWGITEDGNFEGRNIAHRLHHRGDIIRPTNIEKSRRALVEYRARRTRPGLDDKVLTEWNAMMLSSLCEAAMAFGDSSIKNAAVRNASFLVNNLRDANNVWKRSWQADANPQARHHALAHDLAHVVDAMTRMYELTADSQWLDVATDAAQQLINNYWDNDNGGLFTVASDGEKLVVRQKDLMDNATASANSVAALSFLRLSALTDNPVLEEKARDILLLLARVAPSAPSAFGHALSACLLHASGVTEVVIPGVNDALMQTYAETWRPECVVAWGAPTTSSLWQDRTEGFGYVCKNKACHLPVTTEDQFRQLLATNARDE